jgi:hypothetical protein
MRLSNKIMACNLFRKCRKEKFPAGVIVIVVQFVKGVMFVWAPYLLNQFLVDCRDAQDNGTKFHYSHLIIHIALVGWKEPNFSSFWIGKENGMWPDMSPSGRPRKIKINKQIKQYLQCYCKKYNNTQPTCGTFLWR